jgi:hypothetical protein
MEDMLMKEELYNLKYGIKDNYLQLYFVSSSTKNVMVVKEENVNKSFSPEVVSKLLNDLNVKDTFYKKLGKLKTKLIDKKTNITCDQCRLANFPYLETSYLSYLQQYTLLHTLAHLMLEHDKLTLPLDVKEKEADVVSFLVLNKYYNHKMMLIIVNNFDLQLVDIPLSSCERAIKVADRFIEIIGTVPTPVKELHIDKQVSTPIKDRTNNPVDNTRSSMLIQGVYTGAKGKSKPIYSNVITDNDRSMYDLKYSVDKDKVYMHFINKVTEKVITYHRNFSRTESADYLLKKVLLPKANIQYIEFDNLTGRDNSNIYGISGYHKDMDHPIVSVNPESQFPNFVLIHEIAHILLKHYGGSIELSHAIKELEANIVAVLVMGMIGSKTSVDIITSIYGISLGNIPLDCCNNAIRVADLMLDMLKDK